MGIDQSAKTLGTVGRLLEVTSHQNGVFIVDVIADFLSRARMFPHRGAFARENGGGVCAGNPATLSTWQLKKNALPSF